MLTIMSRRVGPSSLAKRLLSKHTTVQHVKYFTLLVCRQGNAQKMVSSASCFRNFSLSCPNSMEASTSELLIPEPPPIPVEEVAVEIGRSLHELGLGKYYTPPGLIQNGIDMLHSYCDMPWVAAIIVSALTIRLLMFPVMVIAQRNAAKMSNNSPAVTSAQKEVAEAKKSGDPARMQLAQIQMMDAMKTSNPLSTFGVMGVQGFTFCSFFFAVRGMCYAGVEGFTYEGMWWFIDLTLMDPTWALPIISCVTTLIIIEIGAELGVTMKHMPIMKWGMRILPFFMFIGIKSLPAGVLCYWTASNLLSLAMSQFLRRSVTARTYFKIPEIKTPKTDVQDNLMAQVRKSMKEFKDRDKKGEHNTSNKLFHNEDKKIFEKSATEVPPVVFPYNPKKIKSKLGGMNAVSTRK